MMLKKNKYQINLLQFFMGKLETTQRNDTDKKTTKILKLTVLKRYFTN